MPCPSGLCLKLKGKQGSGPKGVDDLCFHTYGEFSPPPSSPSYLPFPQPQGPYPSLEAFIPASRPKSQTWGPNSKFWRTSQKAYFLQFWNCKELKFWNWKKKEFMKRFYKQLFYSFKTAKKLLMGTAISYFIILLPLFPSSKTIKTSWLEVRKKWYFRHVFKSPFYAVLIHPKKAVLKRQVCLRFETPDYCH